MTYAPPHIAIAAIVIAIVIVVVIVIASAIIRTTTSIIIVIASSYANIPIIIMDTPVKALIGITVVLVAVVLTTGLMIITVI